MDTHLLQKICHAFAFRANETASLKKLKDVLPWSMVDNLTLREQDDVIEELESFRSRLKKGHHDGSIHNMAKLRQALDNLVRGRAV